MPFINKHKRDIIDRKVLAGLKILDTDELQPGDRCYIFYKDMIRRWKTSPRWTTAHEIFKSICTEDNELSRDDMAARNLAWQVFFNIHVMPYELKKQEENGDI